METFWYPVTQVYLENWQLKRRERLWKWLFGNWQMGQHWTLDSPVSIRVHCLPCARIAHCTVTAVARWWRCWMRPQQAWVQVQLSPLWVIGGRKKPFGQYCFVHQKNPNLHSVNSLHQNASLRYFSKLFHLEMIRRRTLSDRAFPVAAAQVWNSLPTTLTSQSSLHYRSGSSSRHSCSSSRIRDIPATLP